MLYVCETKLQQILHFEPLISKVQAEWNLKVELIEFKCESASKKVSGGD